MSSYLHAFGAFLPNRVVTNAELCEKLSCTAEWIVNVSGIHERRWAGDETTVIDLAAEAARDCLIRADLPASRLGLVILASGSAPPGFPAPGAALAVRMGLEGTPVIDLPMASAGSIFGLALASRLAETYGEVLVVAAEKMSSIIQAHPLDRNTAMLFGDGAGAALVSSRAGKWQILDCAIHTDGQFADELSYDWSSPLRMSGLSVILQASRKLPAVIQEVLSRARMEPTSVSAFLLHQANQNLLLRVAKSLGVAPEKIFSNIAKYGNTSSASMLIAASEWSDGEQVTGPIVFAGFGAGFHWGAVAADDRNRSPATV
jgi:3-oxoacyl-[acyl-carrier-protein] synthase-3